MSTNYYPKAEIKWSVIVETNERSIDGVTCQINPNEVFIRCSNPPGLNEVCDIKIIVPDLDRIFEVHGEVVLSNKYGPDDNISPRGMIVRFLDISSKDRQVIAKEVLQGLKAKEMESSALEALETIAIDQDEISSKES